MHLRKYSHLLYLKSLSAYFKESSCGSDFYQVIFKVTKESSLFLIVVTFLPLIHYLKASLLSGLLGRLTGLVHLECIV